MSKKARLFVLLCVLALTFSLVRAALAEEVTTKSPFKAAVLRMFGVTTKTVEKQVSAVGTGVKSTADVVTQEVKDVGELATGKVSKTKDVLVKPVTGTAEAVGKTAYDVLNAPIEASKEVK